ncbi:fumarylacetoacetate hydrolase family protein [Paenarthrobacter ilicis]|uniref:2-keto-4-pentenoate hydratase/2-oxohepta-3-ene-1,7-dioic acid hydratase in catechol pathway n=1 Tax=Paenarthrobacter ilicis TaxID=43665 RepID=A0ABX0TG04_9MICC|nr:fumarylacetoacetate hydrolase family protein [Paenarthrobacter ilicis]MBM7791927.1 2-keto-4-pentenoate hydratase/2-oxohepta-3-ene-1,7-dioic acid hydratase in catechol pathway [Paenarthrobacter ilicis]NIJ01448.1 2-keto-4-pentenoate hydratase/2-oxohepta-3-ene-1,7-dioic acid hydratase in catechol pathway [Paenarthrobacter ilicis]
MTKATYSLVRFLEAGSDKARAGLLVGERVLPLDPDINSLIQHWDSMEAELDTLAASAGADAGLDRAAVDILAPVEPAQVLQTGANYRKHVVDLAVAHRDAGQDAEEVRAKTAAMMDKRAGQGTPYFFIGLPTAIASATDPLTLPSYSTSDDWELELAAVIGKEAFRVTPEEALEYVFGYTMVNDITTREFVFRKDMPAIGSDWYRAKNARGFLPTGPLLVPAKFFGDPQDVQVTLKLNGKAMQDESTQDMIFGVAKLVSEASQIMPLRPGDLVLTGSPAGNGQHWGRFLQDGDVMEGTITGLGTQLIHCQDEK